jgi:thiol-disulfide isomerase/thioredoxin
MAKLNIKILRNRWAYVLLAILFICLCISMYVQTSRRVRFNEQSNKYHEAFESSTGSTLKIFYADWCGHCKRFKSIYEDELPKLIEEHNINCNVDPIDADKNEEIIKLYDVKGFPTVILELTDGTKIPYDGPREATPIIEFLKKNISA